MKYTFGLIKNKGTWNNPSTDIYYGHTFVGYKPLQSVDIFGLINSTDGNFWLLGEDDDHYWTEAKISEETIRQLYNYLKNGDFSNTEFFSFENDLIVLTLTNLQDNKKSIRKFHKDWIPSLIKTLDIDNPIKTKNAILPVWDKSIIPDRIIYPFLSVEEYVYGRILIFPTSYANKDFELAKFRVLDHLFNTLGNGCRNIEDFQEGLFKKQEIDIIRAERLCLEPTYDGYEEVEIFKADTMEFKFPKSETNIARNVFEEEKEKFPSVIYWIKNDPNEKDLEDIFLERKDIFINTKFRPYPNFQKKYSILWNEPETLKCLNIEWLNSLIWFYETSLTSINEGCFRDYSEFPTGSSKEDKRRIDEMLKFTKDKSYETISKDYELFFDGNMEDFLTRKWLKTKKEYETFINETILLLKEEIKNK